ncbi:hypothetical protein AMATHDRAFT_74580 [Amanita thiersii Skay4041]|uniref:Uncharacterized protein n=1 Tax=Amanita thiersii Skay4041 TaxID=703135 RepID=A0A2A9NVW4_9AGAR|nr:hypothetical protein AMATHDRAFT_74580 [Amanita thiersii Skay4041]
MATSINTKLTRLLGINSPIICAPMANVTGGNLAAQVFLGGGFGFLAAGYDTSDKLAHEISIARAVLNRSSSTILPIGIGFLGWQLDKSPSHGNEMLSVALESRVQAIWLAFGQNLGPYIQYIRDYEANGDFTLKPLIFIQVSSVEDAVMALDQWHPDVLVVQGIEAGGHGHSKALPLLTLLSLTLSKMSPDSPPVLAAGGLATGAQVASMLALGASGVVLGTRFLLSPESSYTDTQRRALINASSNDTVRTMAFDYARNTLGWPLGVDGRALRNHDDPQRTLIWAGTGVGLMNEQKAAKDTVKELHEECVSHIRALAGSLCS